MILLLAIWCTMYILNIVPKSSLFAVVHSTRQRSVGQECTVEKLLEELYQKAAIANLWSLVRHTAGMLRKSIENLGAVSLAVGELMICFSSLYCFRLPLIC